MEEVFWHIYIGSPEAIRARIENTLIYTQLVNFQDDEYVSKVATTSNEACQLLEAGFEYICTTPKSLMLFRKRK
jgi:hypothetical protein